MYKVNCRETFMEEEYDTFISYENLKVLVKEFNIKTKRDFFKYALSADKLEGVPVNPQKVYEEWSTWESFLEVENAGDPPKPVKREVNTFVEDLKDLIDSEFNEPTVKIQSPKRKRRRANTVRFSNKEKQVLVPIKRVRIPDRKGDHRKWISYEQAKDFIREQGVKTASQFYKWSITEKRPSNFPSQPSIVYKEWSSWGDFLGNFEIKWMSYEEAKAFIQAEGITSMTAFRRWKREGYRPFNFPSNPERKYKKKWIGWGNFLGTGRKRN